MNLRGDIMEKDNTINKEVELDTLQVLKLMIDLGGDNADLVANATDEEINQLMQDVNKVRIIT